MSERKCTCSVATQGDLGWVTGSEKCPVHSEEAIKKIFNECLKDLTGRVQTLEIGQGDLYRRIGQGNNTERGEEKETK